MSASRSGVLEADGALGEACLSGRLPLFASLQADGALGELQAYSALPGATLMADGALGEASLLGYVSSEEEDGPAEALFDNVGVFRVGYPQALTIDHVLSTDIPVQLPAWDATTRYPAGFLVSRGGRAFQSVLTSAVSMSPTCPPLENLDQDPLELPPVHVPLDPECAYVQAGMGWWIEIDPELAYVEALLNFNVFNPVEVAGSMTLRVAPPLPYDTVALFKIAAASAELTIGPTTLTQDLQIRDPAQYPDSDIPCYADRCVFKLAETTTRPFTLTLDPVQVDGVTTFGAHTRAGTLVVTELVDVGVTNYMTKVGIRDYSRKERDVFGAARIVERWYQDYVEFLVTAPAEKGGAIRDSLITARNKPTLYIGHDNPARRELQILGLIQDVQLPLQNYAEAYLDIRVESVGVPELVSAVPPQVIPDPPPLPDDVPGPWVAIGHDNPPFVTVVDTGTWEKVEVNFTIPSPANAVMFSPEQMFLILGYDCPPFFTLVLTETWEAQPHNAVLPGPVRVLRFAVDGAYLLVGSNCPPYLTLLEVADVLRPAVIDFGFTHPIRNIDFNEIGTHYVATDVCGNRYWVEYSATPAAPTLLPGPNGTCTLQWSEDHWLFSRDDPANYRVDLRKDDGTTITAVSLPGKAIVMAYDPDHTVLVIGHRCPPYLTVVDVVTFAPVATTFTLPSSVCAIDFTQNGDFLAAVHRTHPYCNLIRTSDWSDFLLSFLEEDDEA